jgi:hypothetical protein
MDIDLIWVRRETKYFSNRGWTTDLPEARLICPTGSLPRPIPVLELSAAYALRQSTMNSAKVSHSAFRWSGEGANCGEWT